MSRATLASLDISLYPLEWEQQTFSSPSTVLKAIIANEIAIEPEAFTKRLLKNNIYQDWINATVFGRYIQRSFAAFHQQSEDSFNMEVPALFRHELMRHAQFLPLDQVLFVAGDMPKSARIDKLFTTTVNPATVVTDAKSLLKTAQANTQTPIINQITIASKQVIGFPVRHNKRTSERTRNEVLILEFNNLRLVNEEIVESTKKSNTAETILLRYYELR